MDDNELFNKVSAVNKVFYDKIFKDPWLKEVFRGVDQDIISRQQTDFIVGALGGPKRYGGRSPGDAHPHIFIQEDMWQVRERLLKEAFVETKFPADLQDKWLKIDQAFKHRILKNSVSECKKRYTMDEIIVVPNPDKKKGVA
jgi:hemoglobin